VHYETESRNEITADPESMRDEERSRNKTVAGDSDSQFCILNSFIKNIS